MSLNILSEKERNVMKKLYFWNALDSEFGRHNTRAAHVWILIANFEYICVCAGTLLHMKAKLLFV